MNEKAFQEMGERREMLDLGRRAESGQGWDGQERKGKSYQISLYTLLPRPSNSMVRNIATPLPMRSSSNITSKKDSLGPREFLPHSLHSFPFVVLVDLHL